MAIAEDRINVSQIKESVVSSFSGGSNEDPGAFSSISDKLGDFGKDVFGGGGFSLDSLSNLKDGIQGKIDGVMNGIQSFADNALSNVSNLIPKNLSFNTSSLGFFENILCGKLPDMSLRLPSLNLDLSKYLNMGFNVTICGNSKKMNPIDAALSVVDVIKDPKGFIAQNTYGTLSKLLNNGGSELFNKLGLGALPTCIMNSVYNTAGSAYSNNGLSLKDKLSLFESSRATDCTGNLIDDFKNQFNINKLLVGSMFGKVSTLPDSSFANKILSAIYVKDPDLAIAGIGNSFRFPVSNGGSSYNYGTGSSVGDYRYNEYDFKGNGGDYVYHKPGNSSYKGNYLTNQLEALHGILGTKNYNEVNSIMSLSPITYTDGENSLVVDYTSLGLASNTVSQSQTLGLKTNSEVLLERMSNEAVSTTDAKGQLEKTAVSLNIIDPNWTKDEDGEVNLYKTQNNNLFAELAKKYAETKSKTFTLDGNVVTTLDLANNIAINNSFDKDRYEKMLFA